MACLIGGHGVTNSDGEETIWRGSVSPGQTSDSSFSKCYSLLPIVIIFVLTSRSSSPEIRNFSGTFVLLAVPIFIAGQRYLQTKMQSLRANSERLKRFEGVFSKVTDTLELYRVKDIETRQPFLYRLCGIENVQLNTSDSSSPFVSSKRSGNHVAWRQNSKSSRKPFAAKRCSRNRRRVSAAFRSALASIIQTFRQII